LAFSCSEVGVDYEYTPLDMGFKACQNTRFALWVGMGVFMKSLKYKVGPIVGADKAQRLPISYFEFSAIFWN
jgi:hypothetical protein